MIFKELTKWKEMRCNLIFLNYRHLYFYRDIYKFSNIVQKWKRDWEGIQTSYPFSFFLFFSQTQGFIWNISKDFLSMLFSLYSEKYLCFI